MVPIWVAAKVRQCRTWSARVRPSPGSRDMIVKRMAAAADPARIRPTPEPRPTARPRNMNTRISAMTPAAQK